MAKIKREPIVCLIKIGGRYYDISGIVDVEMVSMLQTDGSIDIMSFDIVSIHDKKINVKPVNLW